MSGEPRITTLPNGVRVATLAMPGKETAAVSLMVDTGARHEAPAEHGLAHLFEHMVFKGTLTRSARQIAEAIEDVGGSLNAWTSREQTAFHARVLGADLPLAVELIASLVTEPRFDAADLELEREVVLSEIGEVDDTPDDLVFDHLQEAAFAGHPLGRPVLGTPDSLAGLDRAALNRWRDRQYHGPELVLTAAGLVDHEQLAALAERLLGALAPEPVAPGDPARWTGGRRPDDRKGEQLHLALGFEGVAGGSDALYAAQLFATALGGGMSSRLFQALREERGLAYSVSAAHVPHGDTGVLSIHAATRPRHGADALALALEIARSCAATLERAEVDRARAQLRAGLLMSLEGVAGQADWIGRSLLQFGRVLAPAEVLERLDAADVDAVRATASRMLDSAPALAAVGPGADRLAA